MLKSDYRYDWKEGETFEFEGKTYACKDYFLFETVVLKRKYNGVDPNNELFGWGIDPDVEYEGEDADPNDPNYDPEGWRMHADVIDGPQIEWLKKHPEHDWGNALERLKKKGDSRVADWEPPFHLPNYGRRADGTLGLLDESKDINGNPIVSED